MLDRPLEVEKAFTSPAKEVAAATATVHVSATRADALKTPMLMTRYR